MWEIFNKLCEERNITAHKVASELGMSYSTFSGWKAGRYRPKLEKAQKIANYFGVTVEYLMTGKEKSPDGKSELDEKLSLLKNIMDSLSEDDRADVLRYAEFLASKHKQ